MKQRLLSSMSPMIPSLLVGVALGTMATAAPNTTDVSSSATAVTAKPAPVAATNTQSVFVIPAKAAEGKDPFFPQSIRPYGTVAPPKNGKPVVVVAELALRGISGTPDRPLAIINNYTFSAGEEREVTSGSSRLRIRCIEINMSAGAVLIQIGSERRELRLAKP